MEIEKEIQRLKDFHEIQMCASSYCLLLGFAQVDEIIGRVYTNHTPGQKIQIADWGIWEGEKAAERSYHGQFALIDRRPVDMPTFYGRHELTTSYIEVADDGMSAIGIFHSPGYETWPAGQAKAAHWWTWGTYWIAFRKEDGQWRIWQLRIYMPIFCPASLGCVEGNTPPSSVIDWSSVPAEFRPDRPAPDYLYGPAGPEAPYDPVLPVSYETWSDDMSMIR